MYDIGILDHLDAGCIWMSFMKLQDGSVNIPEVLQPYMMGMKVLPTACVKNSKVKQDEWKQQTHIFGGGLVYGERTTILMWRTGGFPWRFGHESMR